MKELRIAGFLIAVAGWIWIIDAFLLPAIGGFLCRELLRCAA